MRNPVFKLKAPLPTEDDEATCLIQWARWQKWKGKRLSDLLVMIPNGAYLGGDVKQRAITMERRIRLHFAGSTWNCAGPVAGVEAPAIGHRLAGASGVQTRHGAARLGVRDLRGVGSGQG